LEDRVVPDCGLDEAGRREFSFGPRSFSFVLGGDLKALVKDEAGKVRGDLPKPGAKDDAAQAEQALADWKLMKKQIKEVATIQAGRLEQAMVTGRRWKVNDFVTLLVGVLAGLALVVLVRGRQADKAVRRRLARLARRENMGEVY
jgi:hypothetical protein